MENIIIIAIVAAIVFLAAFYIYKAKKSGQKCIGCPHSCSCSAAEKASCCSCNQTAKD